MYCLESVNNLPILNNESVKETELNVDDESAKSASEEMAEKNGSQYSDDDGLRDLLEKEQVTEQIKTIDSPTKRKMELLAENINSQDVSEYMPQNVNTT